MNQRLPRLLALACCAGLPTLTLADVDKVYSPRIHAGEWELETRGTYLDDGDREEDGRWLQKFSLGYAFSDRFALEAYLNTEKLPGEAFELEAYELEGRFNLFQNRDYALALLGEVEKERDEDLWEYKIGPLYEQRLPGDFRLRLNAFAEKQDGDDAEEDEVEYSAAAQLAWLEDDDLAPALEYYGESGNHGAGPVLLGEFKLGGHELEWEAGAILGLSDGADDVVYRWSLEAEF
ncbi:hypothetical protein [Alloalcanivorax gelatiniphagus]|uniref:Copper resistance protein B n=1 Tax=Alloalcanivorax gelatiniphagus TaxID=1194167 RepID=A0ABY2XME5_9GAMM|nr:hypothetical protein [Alloalcanivorax gelatiniphagus]TMW13484.1 hypothetical protein FGS76_06690 [Alloalcanivorax gelatiniphagus]|tara:strand:+ start:433 stop:1137 length:705 start_codon:yes stop_codon:yes gene_type:complete